MVQGDPVTILGNETMLREVVDNLCDNAIKYNRPGGSVVITVGQRVHQPDAPLWAHTHRVGGWVGVVGGAGGGGGGCPFHALANANMTANTYAAQSTAPLNACVTSLGGCGDPDPTGCGSTEV